MPGENQMETQNVEKVVEWIVLYKVPSCPGALFTTYNYEKAIIQAPDNYEDAKKIAIAYLNGLNNGARGYDLKRAV